MIKMIYTVTLNPALDYIVRLEKLRLGMINRAREEAITFGGKGVNVSVVLKNLGVPSVAMGFLAGFTGREILERLEAVGCKSDFCWVEGGSSRINVKLKAREETEVNGSGPDITLDDLKNLLDKLDALGQGDTLVLAGAVPPTLPRDTYQRMLEKLKGRGVRMVVDATGEALQKVLPYRPFLIKPNRHEMEELFGKTLKGREEIIRHARLLREAGARNVLVSMAGEGAILVGEGDLVLEAPAPRGEVVNSTGAGDAMVAGFLAGYLETDTLEGGFFTGLAAGSASAFSQDLPTGEEVRRLLETIRPGVLIGSAKGVV